MTVAPLRFHWRLLQRGETSDAAVGSERLAREAALPDLEAQADFCRQGEACGIDSFLVDINYGKPDPMALALALASSTTTMKFMVAHRPGLMSPTLFVQQVNTFSALAGGRITLNVVAGHSPAELRFFGDFLPHDARYERMDEFLEVCRRFWAGGGVSFAGKHYRIEDGRLNLAFAGNGRRQPEIYLGGNSPQAREVAARHASCWLRFPARPDELGEEIGPLLASGTEVGLRMCVMVRESREAAFDAARELVARARAVARQEDERAFVAASDSHSMKAAFDLGEDAWLAPGVWTGAVRYFGAPWVMFLGSPDDVARAVMAYAAAGVTQFILSGWPKRDEMVRFGETVIPLVREMEAAGSR